MTLRQRIVNHLAARPGQKFTNRQLARALGAPEPSVRRATLAGLWRGVADAGKTAEGYLYTAPTHEPTADATGVPA